MNTGETIALIKALCPGGGGGGGEKYIVTLTPTALDYSGTMDKTVAEINAAYEAGQEIVYRFPVSASSYIDVPVTAVYTNQNDTYPSFNAYNVNNDMNVLLLVCTNVTNDGTQQTYSTDIYPLASSGGGVLVVNVTTSGNTMTLDKTWQEIHDSSVPVFGIVRADVGDVGWAFCADIFEDEGDFVVTFVFGNQSRDFTAASASGYPSYTE
jgi:hypothetical protein